LLATEKTRLQKKKNLFRNAFIPEYETQKYLVRYRNIPYDYAA